MLDNKIDFVELEKLVFNPFEWNENINFPMCDLDPDLQYFADSRFSNNRSCDYYTEETFNSFIEKEQLLDRNSPSYLLHNVRSIAKHFPEIALFLNELQLQFDFLTITETWLNETNYELFNIDGYQVPVQYYRSDKRGGGIMLHVKNNLEFKPRNDIVINDGCTESLFIEIEKEMFSALKNIIIGVIYRPPNSNMDNFNNALETTLNYLKRENKVM